jgi:hypothetical protein
MTIYVYYSWKVALIISLNACQTGKEYGGEQRKLTV